MTKTLTAAASRRTRTILAALLMLAAAQHDEPHAHAPETAEVRPAPAAVRRTI